ncbi:MAG: MerR family transcriptional regulator, partial [Ktedonobacteraceae bacterium]
MLKIGDFSKLSLVSVKALRYYDELGLLKPVQVDEFTGYRYYSTSQLTRLNRILALKDLGLALEQIAQLLDQDLTPDQVRGMLKLKRIELEQCMAESQQRLERINAWLHTFEQETIMPAYDVIVKKVAPLRVAQVRAIVPDLEHIGPVLDRTFDQIGEYIYGHGATPVEPAIAVYYVEGYCEQNFEVGACMPFTGSLASDEKVEVCELPAHETVAAVVHHGPFSEMH